MDEHVKVYTDSAIVINRIAQVLTDNNIHSLTKDNVESARVAGFGTSYFDVDLYVYKSELESAENIIKAYLDEQ